MDSNILNVKFIERCNKHADGKPITPEIIYPDNTIYIARDLLEDIFKIYETCNYKAFNNKAFKAVTQENVLKIIEKGILQLFKKGKHIKTRNDYIFNSILRSSLQFLVDHEAVNKDIKKKKHLQKILTHESTINMTKRLYEFKKSLHNLNYLDNYKIDLTHIPLSHYWWKRD